MIILNLKGADVYLAGEIERAIVPSLSKLLGVNEDEILLHAEDGFIYHGGIEQTSYNLIVKVECGEKYAKNEREIANLILKVAKNYSIHTRLYFDYFNEESVYESINNDYPLYLSSSNMVDIDASEDDETEGAEIYDGNIFEEYEDVLPTEEEE